MTLRLVAKEVRESGLWALLALAVGMAVIFLRRAPDVLGPLGDHLLRWEGYYPVDLLPVARTLALPLLWR